MEAQQTTNNKLILLFCLVFSCLSIKAYTIDLSQSYSYAGLGSLSVYLNIYEVHGFGIGGISYQLQNDTLKIDVCILDDFVIQTPTYRETTFEMSIFHTELPNYYLVNLHNGTNCSNLIFSNHYLPNMLSTGINEELTQLNNNINVYPNPSKEFINLVLEKEMEITKIGLYDVLGKRVKIFDVSQRKLNVNDVNTGYYLLKLTTDKGILTKKVQIE